MLLTKKEVYEALQKRFGNVLMESDLEKVAFYFRVYAEEYALVSRHDSDLYNLVSDGKALVTECPSVEMLDYIDRKLTHRSIKF